MNELDTIFDALFRRSVGFDSLSQFSKPMTSFPPYNIVRLSDQVTEIQVAAAGYSADDIKVFERNGVLHIESVGGTSDGDSNSVIYRGIAKRSFKLTFALGNNTSVAEAACTNGMIVVRVKRNVEADRLIELKPTLAALENEPHKTDDGDNVVQISST
jgi:molecular chaperone IbpA